MTHEPLVVPRSKSAPRSVWGLLLALSVLPFLLRLGFDERQSDLHAVQSVYRSWRWSAGVRDWTSAEPLTFVRSPRKTLAEDLFLEQLRKDFKVVEFGAPTTIRAYFEEGDFLRARIELGPIESKLLSEGTSQKAIPVVWQGESRHPDNGLLLGPWLGAVLALAGRPLWAATLANVAVVLLWDAAWSPLDVPQRATRFFREFGGELHARFLKGDWVASELGRVPALGLLVWLIPAFFFFTRFQRRMMSSGKRVLWFLALTLLLEPLVLWTSRLFGKWSSEALWWKVYLGSFSYRFVLAALVTTLLMRPTEFLKAGQTSDEEEGPRRPQWGAFWPLLLPVCFVAVDGWDWLSAAVVPSSGVTLLRLRIFLMGWLLSFGLGSRIFALWIGVFALGVHLAPTTGHWDAAAVYGLMMDGLLLGWLMSPFKGFRPIIPVGGRPVMVLALMAWISGALLSTVGVPLGVCWLALLAAVWGYNQLG